MKRAEHRLAQVAIGMITSLPTRQENAFGFLRPGERLFRPVVDAGNTQREQLDGHARHDLLLRCRFAGKANLGAEDMIVIVEDRDMPLAEIAVGTHLGVARIEAVKIRLRMRQALGHVLERRPHAADVERGVQVAPEHVQVAILSEIAAGHFTDQQEIGLAQVPRELLDRAAEVAPVLERHVFQRVDAEAVAVAQRDPVLVAVGEVVQDAGIVEGQVAEGEEVRPLVLGMRVIEVCRRRDRLCRPACSRPTSWSSSGQTPCSTSADLAPHLFSVAAQPGPEGIVIRERV